MHEFDLDSMFDYRARRPMIAFSEDRYVEYAEPTLQIVLEHDANDTPYLLLAGPSPTSRGRRSSPRHTRSSRTSASR